MRRLGQLLLGAGAALGVLVAGAMLVHLGISNASWMLNVAVAKLALAGAGGLMAAGAMSLRIASRREQGALPR